MSIYRQLAEPFHPSRINWRVAQLKKDKSGARVLAYLDARDVMNRLDAVCGPDKWSCEYIDAGNGKTCCSISILTENGWVTKSNGAGDTNIEGDKGAFSDAFKRAAVCWGIGRYLYGLENVWADIDEWKNIKPSAVPKLNQEIEQLNAKAKTDIAKLFDETVTKLKEMG